MSSPTDAVQFLLGKIDAVELLAASLAAHLSPAISNVLLAQCAVLREKATKGEVLSAFEQGFLSSEEHVLAAIGLASDAGKMRSLSSGEKH
jgi:hypothetical protein